MGGCIYHDEQYQLRFCFLSTFGSPFHVFTKKLPKLFTRMGIGIVVCLLGVASLLIIDTLGHSLNRNNVANITQCVFQVYKNDTTLTYPVLNLHWSVLIPPNLLLRIDPLLVITTTLEFISAQSPQSMKGFLVGVFLPLGVSFTLLIPSSSYHFPSSIHGLVLKC